MERNEGKPRRHSLRLRGYDYSQPGAYFLTVCTQGRRCHFGEISSGQMRLYEAGSIALAAWNDLPKRFAILKLDSFVVMPNHIHSIVHIDSPDQGAMNRAPTLGEVVRTYKASVARSIRRAVNAAFEWQRNYYEHVIRDETELNLVREYIVSNPQQWTLDRENPENTVKRAAIRRGDRVADIFGGICP